MEQQLPAFGNKSDSDNLKCRISVPQMKSEKKDRKERCHSSAIGIHAHTLKCKWIQARIQSQTGSICCEIPFRFN